MLEGRIKAYDQSTDFNLIANQFYLGTRYHNRAVADREFIPFDLTAYRRYIFRATIFDSSIYLHQSKYLGTTTDGQLVFQRVPPNL